MTRFRPVLYLAAGAITGLLGGFGLIADEVVEGDTLDFDKAVLMALREPGQPRNPLGPPWLEEAARDITALGSAAVLAILIVTVVIYLFISGRHRTAWYLAFAIAAGTVISNVLKAMFDRPRPDLTGVTEVFTSSFPSGHAALSAVAFLTLGALLAEGASQRRFKIFYIALAVFLTVLIGLTRIYLGVHYPTDVIAGWSIGAAWALICMTVAHMLKSVRGERAISNGAGG